MMPEIDELDILQKELENRNFVNEAAQLANDYDSRQDFNKPLYLGTIRQKLENQAAAPSSFTNPTNVNLNSLNSELPDHIPYGEGKKHMIENLKSLKDEYLTKGGEDTDFVNKVNDLENFLLYRKSIEGREPYKPGHPPAHSEVQITSNAPPLMPPLGMPGMLPPPLGMPPGMPPPMGMPGMPPGMPPYFGGVPPPFMHDPVMLQMNQMLMQQEEENKKLREALGGIGSTNGPIGDFDGIIG